MRGELLLFFLNNTATTEIYTLSLPDARPIYDVHLGMPEIPEQVLLQHRAAVLPAVHQRTQVPAGQRSEEHTSELQSRQYLVCRLLLEKKHAHLPYPVFCLIISHFRQTCRQDY